MVRKKCSSTSGASIFIALIFLLLCGVAGSLILASASTASKRSSSFKEGRQSYYSLLSAAKLLQQEIEGQTYSRYRVFDESGAVIDDNYYQVPTSTIKDFLKGAVDKKFTTFQAGVDEYHYQGTWNIAMNQPELKDLITTVTNNATDTDEPATEELKDLITTVTAHVIIDKDYNMKLVLKEKTMSCIVTIPAIVSMNTDEVVINSIKGTRYVTTITWSGGQIERN